MNIYRNPQGALVFAARLGVGLRQELMGAVKGGTGQDSQYLLDGPSSIPVVALDSLIRHDMPVRLLKMDVEGMDVDALERITLYLAALGYKLIERWNEAPTYHFSASTSYPVSYRKPAQ